MPPLLLLFGGLAALAALLSASSSEPTQTPDTGPAPSPGPAAAPSAVAPATAAPTSVVFAPTSATTKPSSSPKASTAAKASQRWKVSGGAIPAAGVSFLDRWLSGLTFRGRVSVHAPGTYTDDVVLIVSATTDAGDALDVPTALSRARQLLITSAVYQGGQITVSL